MNSPVIRKGRTADIAISDDNGRTKTSWRFPHLLLLSRAKVIIKPTTFITSESSEGSVSPQQPGGGGGGDAESAWHPNDSAVRVTSELTSLDEKKPLLSSPDSTAAFDVYLLRFYFDRGNDETQLLSLSRGSTWAYLRLT